MPTPRDSNWIKAGHQWLEENAQLTNNHTNHKKKIKTRFIRGMHDGYYYSLWCCTCGHTLALIRSKDTIRKLRDLGIC